MPDRGTTLVRLLRILDKPDDDTPDCGDILARAAEYYDLTTMKMKAVELTEDERLGDKIAQIPRLGDVAMCMKREK